MRLLIFFPFNLISIKIPYLLSHTRKLNAGSLVSSKSLFLLIFLMTCKSWWHYESLSKTNFRMNIWLSCLAAYCPLTHLFRGISCMEKKKKKNSTPFQKHSWPDFITLPSLLVPWLNGVRKEEIVVSGAPDSEYC